MQILATISELAAAKGLQFVVIGGNAVIAYGYPRQTVDLDLLVREQDRRAWDELITPLGYRVHQIQKVFHMYNPAGGLELPPVDLMLVDQQTFDRLHESASEIIMHRTVVRIPSLLNLIALKLHALRSGLEHRKTRDFLDVVELTLLNGLDLASPGFQEILQRYANERTRVELQQHLAKSPSSG